MKRGDLVRYEENTVDHGYDLGITLWDEPNEAGRMRVFWFKRELYRNPMAYKLRVVSSNPNLSKIPDLTTQ